MDLRPLGRSGLLVAPLALGGNVFGWTADRATSFDLLDTFVDAGFNLVDTADVYSAWAPGNTGGESETIIGDWLARSGARDKVVVATKVGLDAGSGKGLSREHILRSCERSRNRLRVDVIDLYQAHRDDPDTPLEETLGAFDELVKGGAVRAVGASNYTPARLAEALAVSRQHGFARFESLQPHYSLVERAEFEAGLSELCLAEGVGVVPYYPLAAGFLTGKYRTPADLAQSPRGARAKTYLNDRGRRVLAALDDVAARHRTAPAAVALAWLLSRPGVTAPIASATSLRQLADLVAAVDVPLSPADAAALTAASV